MVSTGAIDRPFEDARAIGRRSPARASTRRSTTVARRVDALAVDRRERSAPPACVCFRTTPSIVLGAARVCVFLDHAERFFHRRRAFPSRRRAVVDRRRRRVIDMGPAWTPSDAASRTCLRVLGLREDDVDGDDAVGTGGRTIDRETVRRAFRRLVIKAHHDRNDGRSEAYDALCRARDEAYELIDRRDLIACATRYDWRATRRGEGERDASDARESERERENVDAKPRRATSTSTSDEDGLITRTTLWHESRVTALAMYGDVVATGQMRGRVCVWKLKDGTRIASCDVETASSGSEAHDAVSLLRFNHRGRLAATYVRSKPTCWTVTARTMSTPIRDAADAHERRVTAAEWFHGDASGGEIQDVFVTAALDGSVIVRSFNTDTPSARVRVDGCRAVKALDALATSSNEGTFVVADLAGTFQLLRVTMHARVDDQAATIVVQPLTNVVNWPGFGGVTTARLAESRTVREGSSFRLLTVFDDTSTRESRVLEWSIPNEIGRVTEVRGFVGAVPSANSTFRGAVADFLQTRALADEDDDDDAIEAEIYLIAVYDMIFSVDASTRRVLYAVDVDGCRALAPSSGDFAACRVSASRDRVGFDVRDLDDGASTRSCEYAVSDFFAPDVDLDHRSSAPPVYVLAEPAPSAASGPHLARFLLARHREVVLVALAP